MESEVGCSAWALSLAIWSIFWNSRYSSRISLSKDGMFCRLFRSTQRPEHLTMSSSRLTIDIHRKFHRKQPTSNVGPPVDTVQLVYNFNSTRVYGKTINWSASKPTYNAWGPHIVFFFSMRIAPQGSEWFFASFVPCLGQVATKTLIIPGGRESTTNQQLVPPKKYNM